MITARIDHGKDTLLLEMPHHGEPLDNLLGSIGIQVPAVQLPLSGIEETVVTLTYSDQMGKALLDKLDRTESIGELNSLCRYSYKHNENWCFKWCDPLLLLQ